MAIVDLDTAAQEIAITATSASKGGMANPFFFLAGAGLSVPNIPTSYEIVTLLYERFSGDKTKLNPPVDPQEAYSFWFETVMPSAVERSRFLREMVEDKSVSPGAFALSKLLSWESNDGPLFDLALTTNFDDFVERGLRFLGLKHYVHAHPIALDRVDLTNKFEKQVIHLHGSYKFYNCKNTNTEINASSSPQMFESAIVDDFFSNLMPERMPIVIGYAGWSQDIFMKHLAKVAKRQQLPRNAYWFCYNSNAVDGLPSEITEHPNIRFVIDHKKCIDAVESLEAIVARLPTSTFSSTGGLFSAVVADMNGGGKTDKNDTDQKSLSELTASEKPVEAISLNPKWTEPMILLQNGHSRDAWNLVVCSRLEPSSDVEALTLLGILAGVAQNLYYDGAVVECAKAVAKVTSMSGDFGSKTEKEIRAVFASLDAEDYEEHLMTQSCDTCSMPIGIGLKALREQAVLKIACTKCGSLHLLSPSSYAVSLVENGTELSFLRSLYGG